MPSKGHESWPLHRGELVGNSTQYETVIYTKYKKRELLRICSLPTGCLAKEDKAICSKIWINMDIIWIVAKFGNNYVSYNILQLGNWPNAISMQTNWRLPSVIHLNPLNCWPTSDQTDRKDPVTYIINNSINAGKIETKRFSFRVSAWWSACAGNWGPCKKHQTL